jgi:hypothetical protein
MIHVPDTMTISEYIVRRKTQLESEIAALKARIADREAELLKIQSTRQELGRS